MARPEFAPGVTIEITRVGPAGEALQTKRVAIGCLDGATAARCFVKHVALAEGRATTVPAPSVN